MRTVRKAPSGGVRRGLGAIALAAGVTATVPTFAAHLEIGAGYSWGRVVADGTWRQSGNPYTMHTNDPTWYVGVGGHPRPWLAWHADYVNRHPPQSPSFRAGSRREVVACGLISYVLTYNT